MRKDIIIMGMQGSGKGTQADIMLQYLSGYKYFEPGNVFRALVSNDNVIGEYVKETMKKGLMIDESVTLRLFDIVFSILSPDECLLTDGFLRNDIQMHYVCSKMEMAKRDFVGLFFDITKENAVARLLDRAKKEGREDDTLESIEKRISIFENETMPVVNYFKSIGKLIVINANQSVDEIAKEVKEKIFPII